jgi:type I restriction enzyme S subunit
VSDLPPGWTEARFGDITINFDGKRIPIKASERATRRGAYRYFGAQGVIDHINDYIYDGTYLLIAEDGANLASRSQPIAQIASGQFWVNNHAHVAQAADGVSLRYLMHFLNGNKLEGAVRGSAQPKLTQKDLNNLRVPLPASSEQEGIAAAIEEQFSCLDAGIAALVSARARIGTLTRSILLAAVPETYPAHWGRVTVGEAGQVMLGRQRAPQYHNGPNMRPYLRVANVFEDRIDTSDVMSMHFDEDEFAHYKILPGDILLNEGQSPQMLGRPAMYRGDPPDVAFTNSILRFRATPSVMPEWALLVFRRHMHARRFMRESKITTNIAHLSAGRFKSVEFPIPSLDEQKTIVAQTQENLSEAARLGGAVEDQLAKANSLRSSVLYAAFSGKLI